MLNVFAFVGLPYIALFVLIVGSIVRFRTNRFSYTALSSQFLESKRLMWGSTPWHIGLGVVFAGHLIPFLFPSVWHALASHPIFLITVETFGFLAALLCVAGLVVLLARRLLSSRIQSVTTVMDLTVLVVLIAQVVLGIGTAVTQRWGSVWSTHTTTPYLWSLLTLQPNMTYVDALPAVVKLHIAGAWVIALLLPFSRLVHAFAVPLPYLWRTPQVVVWTNARRLLHVPEIVRAAEDSRRQFLKGMVGVGSAAGLLTVGVMDKLVRFFSGPDMTTEEQAELLTKRLQRLQMTAQERQLELERMRSEYIFVAQLKELSPKDGKYFIDYQMRPALAYRDASGMPILISAKCTHLGCTVGSAVDSNGRILCPCHMSYFDAKTGIPEPGSPASKPLPLLGWVLMDAQGKILISQGSDGRTEGTAAPEQMEMCGVYIAKQHEEIA